MAVPGLGTINEEKLWVIWNLLIIRSKFAFAFVFVFVFVFVVVIVIIIISIIIFKRKTDIRLNHLASSC